MANFPIDIEDQSNSGGEYFYFCLPKINYKVTLFDPLAEDDLKFLQPLVIKIKNRILTIHFTKLEKTVSSYYPDNRAASRRSQSNHEAETLNKIISFFNTNFQTLPLDINKGVKHLWDNDHIDCRKVQWRRTSSVAMETMDEDLTFKEQYPIEYPKLITQPLSKALFKHLKEDEYLCDVFEADASKGLINIPRFPKDEKQVENVVTEILTNN